MDLNNVQFEDRLIFNLRWLPTSNDSIELRERWSNVISGWQMQWPFGRVMTQKYCTLYIKMLYPWSSKGHARTVQAWVKVWVSTESKPERSLCGHEALEPAGRFHYAINEICFLYYTAPVHFRLKDGGIETFLGMNNTVKHVTPMQFS